MTIKEILFQLQDDSGNITEDYNKERLTTNEASKQYYATLDNALSSIKKLIEEEVIGEDDTGTITDEDSPFYGDIYVNTYIDRNDQRYALNKILGDSNE